MKAIHRKRLRDLWHMRSQVVAIALVIGCGVATFVMSVSTYTSLRHLRDQYYDRYRFADVFAHAKRAPTALAERIREVPGVARVQTRALADVNLDLPGLMEPATGRLVSIPERPEGMLNALHLRRGRMPEPGRRGEVLLNEAFADAHGFGPGDSIVAIINGRRESLAVVGIALSPEFIYQIRPGEIFPDDQRFGVAWIGEKELAAAFDLDGAFNDVVVQLMPGAVEDEVIERLDDLLEPYGGQGAYTRRDQVSHRYVSDELTQLRAMASIPPVIFLAVAAFLLNVVVSRLVRTQREQIAALKAFGYSNTEVGRHYLGFAVTIIGLGCSLGVLVGAWMGRGLTRMYVQFFRFPEGGYTFDTGVAAVACMVAGLAGLAGVVAAVREAVRLPPAEAMRPEPPPRYRPTFIERRGLQRFLAQTTRMILRHLERQPFKSALSSLGVSLAVAVLVLGTFTADIVGYVLEFHFRSVQRQDVTLTFNEPVAAAGVHAAARLPGVRRVEPFRVVPGRLRAGHRTRRVAVTGLPRDRVLLRILDFREREIGLPLDGVVLSASLAERLKVKAGDTLVLDVLEGERPVREVPVTGTLDDFNGTSVYMEIGAMNRLLGEGPLASGVYALVDPAREREFFQAAKETPAIAGVGVKLAAVRSFEKMMSENLLRMRLFNMVFASIIAFGVVYNSARISLAERERELATLRVIGFTRREVSWILLGEVALLTGLALLPGLVLGRGLAALAVKALETETQRFPLVVLPPTYGFAVLTVLAAALVSALVVRRRIDRLDLVSVLKSRE